ncbi:MAG: ECF transporter S component [Lachnospiraceae bacterium]|nr:ECF transporter S component [Lachnospiraceae bacterium]
MHKTNTQNLTLSAMFVAIGLVLPFLTGQIPQLGSMLLPMHIPVFLCGLICGWRYGAVVGFVLPIMRYAIFGMPILFPTGISMAFELTTYGLVVGFWYEKSRWKCIISLYRSMLLAMLLGRIVWGFAQIILLGMSGNVFSWQMFMTGAFFNAIPGIIVQLILIPTIMLALNRTGLVHFHVGAGMKKDDRYSRPSQQ